MFDRGLTFAGLLGLGLLLALPIWLLPQLPQVVPVHFGLSGQADGWGRREILLLLPAVGIVLYGLFSVLVRIPHRYNYPWAITPQNQKRQFLLARRLLLTLRALLTLLLVSLFLQATFVAQGKVQGVGWWFLPLSLSLIGAAIGFYFRAALRAR